jgi:hypothetical protein
LNLEPILIPNGLNLIILAKTLLPTKDTQAWVSGAYGLGRCNIPLGTCSKITCVKGNVLLAKEL